MATDYVDHIGDRLDHPERVPAELRHLIADDQQRVKRILEFPVSGRVLDVGCSDGAITARIRSRWNVDAYGADTRYTDNFGPFVLWDARHQWPLHTSVPDFDTIYACEFFEHLTDADAELALKNIIAVLRLGGDLIMTVPNRRPHDLYEVGCRARWAWPDHRSSWTGEKLYRFLEKYFDFIEGHRLYENDFANDGIWLIARGVGRK